MIALDRHRGRPGARAGRVLATVAIAAAATLPAVPADAHGGGSGPAIRVVATGLDNPRGIVAGRDGALYVAEAGRGATNPATASCIDTVDESGQPVTNCFGATGAVTRLKNGQQRRVVTGLPSIATAGGAGAVGVSAVAVRPDGLAAGVVNCGCAPGETATRVPAAAVRYAGHVLWIDTNRNRFTVGADVVAYERNNPDAADPGSSLESNPYSVTWGPHGRAVVADAAANDVLSVSPRGNVSLLAVLHAQLVAAPPFLGLPPGTRIPMQAVPDAVTRGPDGAYYVGVLTGFPFPIGAASVYRLVPGQQPTVYATGFTNIIGVAFDHKRRLVVLEHATNSLLDEASPGALWVVDRQGNKTLVARDGLVKPGGVAVGRDGRAYVTNNSIFAGQGQVLSIRLP